MKASVPPMGRWTDSSVPSRSPDQKARTYKASATIEKFARVLEDRSSGEPNIHIAPPKIDRVIQPRVPAWT